MTGQAGAQYFYEASLNYISRNLEEKIPINESGELIPRINCFLKRGGNLDSKDGEHLLSIASKLGLHKTVEFIRSHQAVRIDPLLVANVTSVANRFLLTSNS